MNFNVENHCGATHTYRQQQQENIDYLFAAINAKHEEAVTPPPAPEVKKGFFTRWLSL